MPTRNNPTRRAAHARKKALTSPNGRSVKPAVTTQSAESTPDAQQLKKLRRVGSELFFGFVAPLGAPIADVEQELRNALIAADYDVVMIELAQKLDVAQTVLPDGPHTFASDPARQTARKMLAGTAWCAQNGWSDGMAILAIQEIQTYRRKKNTELGLAEDRPLPRTAYIIHQLKRPREVARLREVYEDRFLLIGVWEWRAERIKALANKFSNPGRGSKGEPDTPDAEVLVTWDESELDVQSMRTPHSKQFGQDVRETFPLADFFVARRSSSSIGVDVRRFISALFGDPKTSPSRDEMAMYFAYGAALRSGSLARQVGAALYTSGGDSVISVGTNEVPKPGGGTFWEGDPDDDRDLARGADNSEVVRQGMVVEMLEQLRKAGWLNSELSTKTRDDLYHRVREGKQSLMRSLGVMDILDYVRAMHAEQAAVLDAALRGVSVKDATLYVTTFPCHECARMLLGAGVARVVYVEPYPKSHALSQYEKSINASFHEIKSLVQFVPFLGIAPRAFRRVYEFGTRKDEMGKLIGWDEKNAEARGISRYPNHVFAEQVLLADFNRAQAAKQSRNREQRSGET